jgi:hypothetical protein
MSAFSASEAALEGFRLTRERPGTIAAWSAVYAVSMIVIGEVMLSSLGAEAVQIARKGRYTPADVEAVATKLAHSIPAFILVLLLAVALISIITAGIFRLVLRPQERGIAHLRLGADELRLTAMNVLLFGIGLVCLFVGFVAIRAAENGGPVAGVVAGAVVAALTIWIGVRLSLATPTTFQAGRISLVASWELTRGRFWPLFGMILLAVIFYVIIWLLVTVIWFTLVSLAGGPDAVTNGAAPLTVLAGIAAFAVQMLLSVIQLVMIYAPFAVAYQQLHGDPPTRHVVPQPLAG